MAKSLVWKRRALLVAVALALTAGLGVPEPALAGTFTVNSAADPGDGVCSASECTLREAISAANAGPGTDTINFDPGVFSPGTITPTTPLPPLTHAGITIDGSGTSVTLDGSLLNSDIAFEGAIKVLAPAAAFKGFTIRNAPNFGILVFPAGPVTSLTVTNMTIAAESQYGVSVFSDGAIRNVSVSGSIISGTGGVSISGVRNSGISIMNNVSFSASPLAEAVGIFGGSNRGISVTGNGPIDGEVFMHSLGDGNSHVSISGNSHISGGIVLSAPRNSGLSVRGNGAITGRGVAVLGDNNRGISVRGNESIACGGVTIAGISGASNSNSDISVRDNGVITGGDTGVVIDGARHSGISVRSNGSVIGRTGIFVSGDGAMGARSLISDNIVQASVVGSGIGINITGSDRNRLQGNHVAGFSIGVAVQAESNFNTIRRNVIGVTSVADLFWDETGTGNRWIRNECDTSLPPGLCD